MPEMNFYSVAGLRLVALLVQAECDRRGRGGQKELAQQSGARESTIGRLRERQHYSTGPVVAPPDPETILKLAPYVQNPTTGEPFAPWDLLSLACGVPTINLSPSDAFQIVNSVGVSIMCAATLSMIIKSEFQRQGLDPDNLEHFQRFADAGVDLWNVDDKRKELRTIVDGTYRGVIDRPLLEDLGFTLGKFSGQPEAYDYAALSLRLSQAYQHHHNASNSAGSCCL